MTYEDKPQVDADQTNQGGDMAQDAPVNTTDMAAVYDHGADAFQNKAPRLLSWEAVGAPALDKALAPILEREDLATLNWLDEGAASGRIVGHLIGLGASADHIDGVEISPKQVELAQANPALQGAHFAVGNIASTDAGENPMLAQPGKYDVATQHMVAEHLDDDQLLQASRNTLTALKPGGTFVMICTHPDRVMHTEGTKIRPDGSYTTTFPWGGEGENYYRTTDRYEALLREAGFEIASTESLPIPAGDATRDIDPEAYASYERQGYWDADGHGTPLNVRLAIVARKPAA